MTNYSLPKDKIKILLLEGVHKSALETFKAHGYRNIEYLTTSLTDDYLKEKIAGAHIVGIRSRTQLSDEVLSHANKLIAIGCFCIGTNQVALSAANLKGIPVFNAPFSNTRSVAELVLGEIILLLRGIPEKNALAHRGIWRKSAVGSVEARNKILGIIGYGHIGTQLGLLAETLGMRVKYYDIEAKLPLGNACQVSTLAELLQVSDVVSLHVPETVQTQFMISDEEFSLMKPGAILINASRGTVVNINSLALALKSNKIAGAAIDVFPVEPKSNDEEFISVLRTFENVILTPHIGGSTLEAQASIGVEVADKLINYSDKGISTTAVNFPEVLVPSITQSTKKSISRLLHIHHNQPGMMNKINQVMTELNINISGQYLQTNEDIGYVVFDIETQHSQQVLTALKAIAGTIRTRILH